MKRDCPQGGGGGGGGGRGGGGGHFGRPLEASDEQLADLEAAAATGNSSGDTALIGQMSDTVFVEVVRKDIDGASFHRGLVMDFSEAQVRCRRSCRWLRRTPSPQAPRLPP